jgi:hypothetical protein
VLLDQHQDEITSSDDDENKSNLSEEEEVTVNNTDEGDYNLFHNKFKGGQKGKELTNHGVFEWEGHRFAGVYIPITISKTNISMFRNLDIEEFQVPNLFQVDVYLHKGVAHHCKIHLSLYTHQYLFNNNMSLY